MFSFFINLYRFVKILIRGIKKDPQFRFLLVFIVLLLTGSTVFYCNEEGWSVIDSLYFSVMTMSTVGYGDFVPSTPLSKVFTIVFTFLSIGAFVGFTAKAIQLAYEGRNSKKLKRHKKKQKSTIE